MAQKSETFLQLWVLVRFHFAELQALWILGFQPFWDFERVSHVLHDWGDVFWSKTLREIGHVDLVQER